MSLPPDKPRSNAAIDGCAGPPSRDGQNHQGSAHEHRARQRSVLLEPAGRRSDRRLPDDPARSRAPWSSTNRTATSAWPTVGRASGYRSPTEHQRGRPSCYRRGPAARDHRHASPAYAAAHASRRRPPRIARPTEPTAHRRQRRAFTTFQWRASRLGPASQCAPM